VTAPYKVGYKLSRTTIKLDRLIVLSKSILLGWFLNVSLILIIKGRYPREETSFILIITEGREQILKKKKRGY
jgi:hypothetical protein